MPDVKERHEYIEETSEHIKHTTPGVGADIFIRKKAPGAEVGKGYIIDVYENGVKQDTHELPNKREVTDLIRKFKEKYRTDRAFQNEIQVHITYKTKEERGEKPERKEHIPVSAPEEGEAGVAPDIGKEKSTPKVLEVEKAKGERTMASINNVLLKQADQISGLLHQLMHPELPIITREAQGTLDPTLESISSVPETPPEPGDADDKNKVKGFIVTEIVKKYTSFVKDKVDNGVEAVDELYNPLKKWYGKLGRKIEEWNKMSDGVFNRQDMQDIVNKTEKVLLSKNPIVIAKATGVQIDQQTADLMFEVGSKSIGKEGDADKGAELGGDPEETKKASIVKDEDASEKGSQTTEDRIAEFTKHIQTIGDTTPIEEIAKDLKLTDTTMLLEMKSFFSNKNKKTALNESEATAKRWIDQELLEREKKSSFVDVKTNEFWKYAADLHGTYDIENAFLSWLKTSDLVTVDIGPVWNKISNDIYNMYIKTADYDTYGIGAITLEASTQEGPRALAGGYYEWVPTKESVEFVAEIDPTNEVLGRCFDTTVKGHVATNQEEANTVVESAILGLPSDLSPLNEFLSFVYTPQEEGVIKVLWEIKDAARGAITNSGDFTIKTVAGSPEFQMA